MGQVEKFQAGMAAALLAKALLGGEVGDPERLTAILNRPDLVDQL